MGVMVAVGAVAEHDVCLVGRKFSECDAGSVMREVFGWRERKIWSLELRRKNRIGWRKILETFVQKCDDFALFYVSIEKEDGVFRTIVLTRETQGVGRLEGANPLTGAKDIVPERCAMEEDVLEIVVDEFGRRVVVALYLVANYLHLLVYLPLRINGMEHHIGQKINGARQVVAKNGRIEHGMALGGIGIELAAHAFKAVNHIECRPSLRSLERHVLAEMSQSFFASALILRASSYLIATIHHRRGRWEEHHPQAARQCFGFIVHACKVTNFFRNFARMKIGNIEFGEQPVFLAPMEDVTDIGFRMLCKRFGAAMVYTEFVSAEALVRNIAATVKKLTICNEERPVGIQIYGRTVEAMVEAAKIVEQVHPDVIDLNFGCPVKKVAGKGAGSGMLKNIPLLLEITREVVKAVNTPVTVKTRLGWDHENLIITDLAEQLQDCGIQALTIHGRTRSQMYTGQADWTLIGKVKKNPRIHIPIIGNGDITTPEGAREAFERYGVDAIMVGRATFGRPWLFKEIGDYLREERGGTREERGERKEEREMLCCFDKLCSESQEPVAHPETILSPLFSAHSPLSSVHSPLSTDDKIDILLEQLRINVERIDEYRGILHTRRHLAASPIFKGIPDFRQTRIAMLRATTVEELTAILEQCRGLVKS